MDFFRMIFGAFLPKKDSDEVEFDDVKEDYYLTESSKNMTTDSLDGGKEYNEPDYVIKY